MKINSLHLKSDIYLRVNDIWIGSEDGEEVFGRIENEYEVMKQINEILNKYNDKDMDMKTLLSALNEIMAIEVEIPWIDDNSFFSRNEEINTIGKDIISFYFNIDGTLENKFKKILLIDDNLHLELIDIVHEGIYVKFDTILGYSAEVYDEFGNRLHWITDCKDLKEVVIKLKEVLMKNK